AALQPVGDPAAEAARAGYFRARRFWQQLALRLDLADGRALAAAFAQCRAQDEAVRRALNGLCAPFEQLLGPALSSACGAEPAWIAQQRTGELRVLPEFGSLYGDLAAATPAAPQLRMPVPPHLLLAAAAPLAVPAGQTLWRPSGGEEAATQLAIPDPPDTMCGRCVRVLQELQRPDARAEPLFASAAWADLQANAQLAAWAQSHHTFVLEERFVSYGCLTGSAPARVAPYPRWFGGLAACAAGLARWRRAGITREDRLDAQARLAAWAKVAARIGAGDRSEAVANAAEQGSYGAMVEMLCDVAEREHA